VDVEVRVTPLQDALHQLIDLSLEGMVRHVRAARHVRDNPDRGSAGRGAAIQQGYAL
jgi:hypothetical protein